MDRLYTLIIIILIGFFIYWYQLKNNKINKNNGKHKKQHKRSHRSRDKKKKSFDNNKEQNLKNNIQKVGKKVSKKTEKIDDTVQKKGFLESKKVSFNEETEDEVTIDSLESSDYSSLLSGKKDNDSDSEFLDE